jgi:tetratricopeptide (TPR) repeat protein
VLVATKFINGFKSIAVQLAGEPAMSAEDGFDMSDEWYEKMNQLRKKLEELKEVFSISDFLYSYYNFILSYIDALAPYGLKWLKAFQAMLEYESWRHKAMRRLRETSNMNLLLVLGVEMRNALTKLLNRLDKMDPQNNTEMIVLQLMRAECLYQLGYTEGVIEALDKAIEAGCDHPLVYFALGFNIYRQALQEYVEIEPGMQRAVITDRARFESLCEKAVGAFRSGISQTGTTPMDAQLHFWIGIVYETLGRLDEAKEEYEKALEIAPELSKEVEHRLKHIERTSPQRHEESKSRPEEKVIGEASQQVGRLGGITDEELSRMSELLSKIDTLTEFLEGMKGTEEN